MAREKKLANGFTRRQWAFIREYVRTGGNGTQAAIAAGYGKTSAHSRAWELLERTDIIQGIQDETRKQVKALGTKALEVLRELAVNASNETVRYQAAADLANRSGYKLPDKVEIQTRQMQPEEIDDRIKILIEEIEQTGDSHLIQDITNLLPTNGTRH